MTDLIALESTLRALLDPDTGTRIGIGVSDPRVDYGGLFAAEDAATAHMVPKRRLEFAAGRHAVRAAMADLGVVPTAIPMADDRAPIWPDHLVGSIAHCDTACIACVTPVEHLASIGLDIEEATPLAPDLWGTVLTQSEQTWLKTHTPAQQGLLAKQIFCAKEAVYKAQYPLTGRMLEFQEVEVFLETEMFSTRFHDLAEQWFLIGNFRQGPDYMITCLCIPSSHRSFSSLTTSTR